MKVKPNGKYGIDDFPNVLYNFLRLKRKEMRR